MKFILNLFRKNDQIYRLRAQVALLKQNSEKITERNSALLDINQTLKAALQQYANRDNWEQGEWEPEKGVERPAKGIFLEAIPGWHIAESAIAEMEVKYGSFFLRNFSVYQMQQLVDELSNSVYCYKEGLDIYANEENWNVNPTKDAYYPDDPTKQKINVFNYNRDGSRVAKHYLDLVGIKSEDD